MSNRIIGCFFDVHNAHGYGFVESVYAKSMVVALQRKGLRVEREVPIAVYFEGVDVGTYRIDMLVEERVILEIKASERMSEMYKVQLRNYLAIARMELGLVLHFGLKATFCRVLGPRIIAPAE